LARPVKL
jgi:hypothetical protein